MAGSFCQTYCFLHFFLALFSVAALTARADGGFVGFQNDTDRPMVVRTCWALRTGAPAAKTHYLYPGEIAWDCIVQPGARLVTIADQRRPGIILFQERLPCGTGDTLLSIRKDAKGHIQLSTPKASKMAAAQTGR